MISGIGTDIIDIRRIKRVIDIYGVRFKKKCFHEEEIEVSEKRYKSAESYAKRYAAKEACAKALGTGLARGVFWKDIEIKNNVSGKPFILLHNKAYLRGMNISNKNLQIDVSLSDERNYAIANVVIFNNEK